jgi:site-specific recombinase XerD
MKRSELIDSYYKLLHLMSYSTRTEKSYLHHLNLFLDYVNSVKVSNLDAMFLPTYFNWLKEVKNFSYSSMKQALAAIRFLYLNVLIKK